MVMVMVMVMAMVILQMMMGMLVTVSTAGSEDRSSGCEIVECLLGLIAFGATSPYYFLMSLGASARGRVSVAPSRKRSQSQTGKWLEDTNIAQAGRRRKFDMCKASSL